MKLLEVLSQMKCGERAHNNQGNIIVKKFDIGDTLRDSFISLWSDETLLGDDWEIERKPEKKIMTLTGVRFIPNAGGGYRLCSDQGWLNHDNLPSCWFKVTLEWEE